MERLTKKEMLAGHEVHFVSGDDCFDVWSAPKKFMGKAIDRLAAYEDTMPLERAQELAKAEKDGRLVVLPCKVGDFLYEVDAPEYGVITCKVLSIYYHNGPMFHVPGNDVVSALSVEVEVIDGHGKGSSYNFELRDFGKTVFLTCEEAETALKKRKDDTFG